MELGQARDELRNLVQQLVEVEDRRDFASQREQRRQRDRLCWPGGEEIGASLTEMRQSAQDFITAYNLTNTWT